MLNAVQLTKVLENRELFYREDDEQLCRVTAVLPSTLILDNPLEEYDDTHVELEDGRQVPLAVCAYDSYRDQLVSPLACG